jgi:uncharacterized protein
MSAGGPPKIEFPCDDYMIKVIGDYQLGFVDRVLELTQLHAPEVGADKMQVRYSEKGNFCSVTLWIRATGEPQLQSLHQSLRSYAHVRMVL